MRDAVLEKINEQCELKDIGKILALSKKYNMPYMGMFFSTAIRRQNICTPLNQIEDLIKYYDHFHTSIQKQLSDDTEIKVNDESDPNKQFKVKLLCNWTDKLDVLWSKMKPNNSRIILTDNNPDYWVIINKPLITEQYEPEKTIIFQMEPYMYKHPEIWGEWASPDPDKFLKIFTHKTDYNNIEWHLDYCESSPPIVKDTTLDNRVSAILSDKYNDPGQIKRIDFIKFIERIVPIDVFGSNMFLYKSYKGELPYGNKNNGLMPYKYHFNAENNSIPNYFTEKIVDAILSECLCFYWGCPNIAEYIDPRAYIILDLDDISGSLKIIQNAIDNDEWSKRIDIIRAEKKKLMTEMNFFTRIEKIFTI